MSLLAAISSSRRRGGAFSPLSLNPALWLDASDASTLYDAASGGSLVNPDGAIARMEDKSGSGRHAVSTGTARPIRKTSVQKGLDVARFDLLDDGVSGPLNTSARAVYSVFVINAPSNSGKYSRFFTVATAASPDNSGFIPLNRIGTADVIASYAGGFTATLAYTSGAHMFSHLHSGTSYINYVDQSPSATANGSIFTGATRYGIGTSPLVSGPTELGADLCEMIVFNSSHTNTQRDAIFAYLTAKWLS